MNELPITKPEADGGVALPQPCSPVPDTPETDAEASKVWIKCEDTCCEVWAEKNGDTINVVDADFARKLERERDALRNAIRFASDRLGRAQGLTLATLCDMVLGEDGPRDDAALIQSVRSLLANDQLSHTSPENDHE